jgi:hypothetical protein
LAKTIVALLAAVALVAGRASRHKNYPSPRWLSSHVHPVSCQFWQTGPVNFGGMVEEQVRMDVQIARAETYVPYLKKLPRVEAVRIRPKDWLDVAPSQPPDVPRTPTPGKRSRR